ncbi:class III lanthionine synthetase LanKC N-terminal domain-containing protein [Tengunoibacter tsumagoiensis]|uniref:Protein kinase domain-containing protein n=1 Tax=Tengunoibacter tsumagoiensis TaxID=2014871 RepID=A0A402A692_9CHLR|nr:lanthionine synthetase LanC family protein [Tengunoibacter tsumagoiensis]GCE14650.1 hypothetical protein KTT_45090 [Tengunoibacter tsumagoiensis]
MVVHHADNSLNSHNDEVLIAVAREVCAQNAPLTQQWNINYAYDAQKPWLRFVRQNTTLPSQGWKLHVSASIDSAAALLRCVLPLLLAESSAFKCAATIQHLNYLNQGQGGNSQLGKFITIYPANDEEAVRLALLLDNETRNRGLGGPNIPSDHILCPGSLVYYRYGGFDGKTFVQQQNGMISHALMTPENELIVDRRTPRYSAPEWVTDPFKAAGISVDLPPMERLLEKRYLILATISANISHIVYLGADLENSCSCIVKGLGYGWQYNTTDKLGRTKLLHEGEIMARLHGIPFVPELYAVIETEYDAYLIMEDIEGKTLTNYVSQISARGEQLPFSTIVQWSIQLAQLFAAIHARGIVYGDIKSSNIILGDHEQLYLIDFDTAHESGDTTRRFAGRGTRGYMSPQVCQGQTATIADDIFSLGALYYFLLTGIEVSTSVDPLKPLIRPLEWIRPDIPHALQQIILRCTAEQPEDRYASMRELQTALEHVTIIDEVIPFGCELTSTYIVEAKERYRHLASRLLETLCAQAQKVPGEPGLAWMSLHHTAPNFFSRDLNTGNSGTLLALAELTWVLDSARGREVLAEGALWLRQAQPLRKPPLAGLYAGIAGSGVALLKAGQVLKDPSFIDAAIERSRIVASLPLQSLDIIHGAAGRLRFHLLLWDETHDQEHLEAAQACGEYLLSTATFEPSGTVYWDHVSVLDEESKKPLLGYAHGTAGIADALLELFETTVDERYVPAIVGAAAWLQLQLVSSESDPQLLSWPRAVGGEPAAAFWCHGATGIGRFFLHLAKGNLFASAAAITARVAKTVARGHRWASTTQCHGLAGNIEFLLDLYRFTGDTLLCEQAFVLGRLLETFAGEQDGLLVFPSEFPGVFTPDYMIGYAGVALCLLRLSAPELLPHALSRAAFRAYSHTVHHTMPIA